MVTLSPAPSVSRASVSSRERRASSNSSVASTSIAAPETETPTSASAAASACSRRRAYGAPEAPVMPRNTRICAKTTRALLGGALGRLEECRELREAVVAEVRERRHRRAGVLARRALEVLDLEVDPLVLRAFRSEIGRAEVRAAVAEVGVAVQTARDREQLRPGDRLLVPREALLLRPRRHMPDQLGAESLLRGRALVREDAHRDDDEDRRD